jgi:uncharacterized protein (TIGR03435 family)
VRSIVNAIVLAAVVVLVRRDIRLVAAQRTSSFEVASIKESHSVEQDGGFRQLPGRFTVTNQSLRWIIRYAYRLRDYQVVQAPSWTETRYSISATFTEAQADNAEVRVMLQRLLTERFALRARRETRSARIYLLTKARGDDTLGPQLSRSAVDCEKAAAERAAQGAQAARPGSAATCTLFASAWSIRGFTRTISQLVPPLDEVIGDPVVDRTGLAGTFNFELRWGKDGDVPIDPSRQTVESLATLFTAIQEQLGLKLESSTGPLEVLVIDHIEKPMPD